MATEQTGNESQQELVNKNQLANTSMKTHDGFGGMVYEQYLKAKENAEAYPYVWSSYLIVYGGFGMWVAYRYRKLMKTEDRVRGLQERLRNIRKEREVPSSVECQSVCTKIFTGIDFGAGLILAIVFFFCLLVSNLVMNCTYASEEAVWCH
nr:transmembrane protein [Tanacetum cinerariifolium]